MYYIRRCCWKLHFHYTRWNPECSLGRQRVTTHLWIIILTRHFCMIDSISATYCFQKILPLNIKKTLQQIKVIYFSSGDKNLHWYLLAKAWHQFRCRVAFYTTSFVNGLYVRVRLIVTTADFILECHCTSHHFKVKISSVNLLQNVLQDTYKILMISLTSQDKASFCLH